MSTVDETTPNRGLPLPHPSNKLKDDVARLRAALLKVDVDIAALLLAVAAKAAADHSHTIEDITGLLNALNSKADGDHEHRLDDLADVNLAGAANGQFLAKQGSEWIPAFVAISSISGLTEKLAEKATPADVAAAVNALVGAAPGTLDTLAEIALALGNDPNLATTLSNAIGGKLAKAANLSDLSDPVAARTNLKIWTGTQAQYDALTSKDAQTIYITT